MYFKQNDKRLRSGNGMAEVYWHHVRVALFVAINNNVEK